MSHFDFETREGLDGWNPLKELKLFWMGCVKLRRRRYRERLKTQKLFVTHHNHHKVLGFGQITLLSLTGGKERPSSHVGDRPTQLFYIWIYLIVCKYTNLRNTAGQSTRKHALMAKVKIGLKPPHSNNGMTATDPCWTWEGRSCYADENLSTILCDQAALNFANDTTSETEKWVYCRLLRSKATSRDFIFQMRRFRIYAIHTLSHQNVSK